MSMSLLLSLPLLLRIFFRSLHFTSVLIFQICIKGPNVCKGYLYDPEKTAELFDKDGWLRTQDIGEWLPVSGKPERQCDK